MSWIDLIGYRTCTEKSKNYEFSTKTNILSHVFQTLPELLKHRYTLSIIKHTGFVVNITDLVKSSYNH